MILLTTFSVPDFVFFPEDESVYMRVWTVYMDTEHKGKTRITRCLVSLLEVIFESLFYILIASISLCSMGNFWHLQTDNARRLIKQPKGFKF